MRHKYTFPVLLSIILIIWCALFVRTMSLSTLPPGISEDEATDGVDAFHISQSGTLPLFEDFGRVEPLYRMMQGASVFFLGHSLWALRLCSALFGILTIAAAYLAGRQFVSDFPPLSQHLSGLASASVLAVSMSHIVLTRSTYRAVSQPFFTLLFVTFLLVGLRTGRKRVLVLSGVCLAGTIYSYTAGWVVPVALVPFGIVIILNYWNSFKTIRIQMQRLAIVGITCGVLVLPFVMQFVTRPTSVIGRASSVRGHFSLLSIEQEFVTHFFRSGDINPQYNAVSAPLIPVGFQLLFIIGLVLLLVRIKVPSSFLVSSLLLLSMVPVVASEEMVHGLRIAGAYAPIALLTGLGAAFIGWGITRWKQPDWKPLLKAAVYAGLALLFVVSLVNVAQVYNAYWANPAKWPMYDKPLDIGEWFFRTDRRSLLQWIDSQDTPILIPADEFLKPTSSFWLTQKFPTVQGLSSASSTFALPPETTLVIPWSLETSDLLRNSRQFMLLTNHTALLLPPVSMSTHEALLSDIDASTPIEGSKTIKLLGRAKQLTNINQLDFEVRHPLSLNVSGELSLVGWQGSSTLASTNDVKQSVIYTINVAAQRKLGHDYSSFVQLVTQDYKVIAGQDFHMWRWMFPTTMWKTSDVVSCPHTLNLPEKLEPGAYRLLVGFYNFVDTRMPMYGANQENVGDTITAGWIKVPQIGTPAISPDAQSVEATLGDSITLKAASVTKSEANNLQLSLYWESTIERPNVDATIFIHVLDRSGKIIAQQDIRPWGGQYPTFIWSKSELIKTDHTITLPDGYPHDFTVRVGMYETNTLKRLSVTQNGQPLADGLIPLDIVSSTF